MKNVAKAPMFVKPSKEEVIEFIDQTMRDWPRSFCEVMGDRFFEFYQSVSWRISKNIPMKDWKAAWRGRWVPNLGDKDKKLLQEHMMMPANRIAAAERQRQKDGIFADQFEQGPTPLQAALEYYDKLLMDFSSGKIGFKQLGKEYDRLKALGVIWVSREQREQLFVQMGNDRDYGKAIAVQYTFRNLMNAQMTFKNYYDEKTARLAGAGK